VSTLEGEASVIGAGYVVLVTAVVIAKCRVQIEKWEIYKK